MRPIQPNTVDPQTQYMGGTQIGGGGVPGQYMNGRQLGGAVGHIVRPRTGNAIMDVSNIAMGANDRLVHEGQGAIGAGTEQAGQYLGQGYDQSRQGVGQTPNRVADLYGGGLGAGFTPDPGYQQRLQQGQEAIMHGASAAGGRHGGNTLRAMTDFNQNMASNEFGNYANRQLGMATGADQQDWSRNTYLGNAAQGYGQGQANLYAGQGTQLAGLGMQGGAMNSGLYQSQLNGLIPPPQQPKGPSGKQQLLGLGVGAAATYFSGGNPMVGMAAQRAVSGGG